MSKPPTVALWARVLWRAPAALGADPESDNRYAAASESRLLRAMSKPAPCERAIRAANRKMVRKAFG